MSNYAQDLDLSEFDLFAPGPKIPDGTSFAESSKEVSKDVELESPEVESEVAASPESPEVNQPAETSFQISKKSLALKKQEEKIANDLRQLEEMKSKIEAYENAKAKARQNPIEALQSLGIDFEYIQDWLINGEEQPVEDKVAQLERKLEAEKLETQRLQVEGYKRALFEGIKAEPEKYELIQLHNAYEDVYELQVLWKETHKKDLTAEQAADLVEEELLRREEEKIQKSTKLRQKFSPAEPKDTKQTMAMPTKTQEKEKTATKDTKSSPKSISNLTASSQSASTKKKHLSDDEAIELISKNFSLFS